MDIPEPPPLPGEAAQTGSDSSASAPPLPPEAAQGNAVGAKDPASGEPPAIEQQVAALTEGPAGAAPSEKASSGPPETGGGSAGEAPSPPAENSGAEPPPANGQATPDSPPKSVQERVMERGEQSQELTQAFEKFERGEPLTPEEQSLLQKEYNSASPENAAKIEKRQDTVGKTIDDLKGVGEDMEKYHEEFKSDSAKGALVAPLNVLKGAGEVSIGTAELGGEKLPAGTPGQKLALKALGEAGGTAMESAEVIGEAWAGKPDGIKTTKVLGDITEKAIAKKLPAGGRMTLQTVTTGLGLAKDIKGVSDASKSGKMEGGAGLEKTLETTASMTNKLAKYGGKLDNNEKVKETTKKIGGGLRIYKGLKRIVKNIPETFNFLKWRSDQSSSQLKHIQRNAQMRRAYEQEYRANQIRLRMSRCKADPSCSLFQPPQQKIVLP